MKYISLTVFIVLYTTLFAQDKIQPLAAPSSPASTLLGMQPSVLLAPKTHQALEAAVFSNFFNTSGKTIIPNDFALEFTPYWSSDHGLSLSSYMFPTVGEQFIRNSSLSLASTQQFLLGDSTSSNCLSFGYRTTFYFGHAKDKEHLNSFMDELALNNALRADVIIFLQHAISTSSFSTKEEFIVLLEKELPQLLANIKEIKSTKQLNSISKKIISSSRKNLPEFSVTQAEKFNNAFVKIIVEDIEFDTLFEKFEDYLTTRPGLSLDVAYANLLNFPTNNFDLSVVPQQSVWLTPSFRFKDKWSKLKILGVLRYEWYNTDYYKKYFPSTTVYSNNIDFGLSLVGEFKKFSLQFEMVGRKSNSLIPAGTDNNGNELFRIDKADDFQCLGSFNYHLNDEITLSYSLGNRFNPILNPLNTFVSMLSLNFGFGAPSKSSLKD